MEQQLPPVYDDEGREVDRAIWRGQKQLGQEIGATGIRVGELLCQLNLLQLMPKEPTPHALATGAGIMVTIRETADGPHRYPLWNRDLVIENLRDAFASGAPASSKRLPAPARHGYRTRANAVAFTDDATLESRVEDLERRLADLERRLR
jgi:hypothetical protein